jgi:hypothetical protein
MHAALDELYGTGIHLHRIEVARHPRVQRHFMIRAQLRIEGRLPENVTALHPGRGDNRDIVRAFRISREAGQCEDNSHAANRRQAR